MRDFRDFYTGTYNGEGIVNSYLRLLDVYSELSIAKQEFLHPNQKYQRIKIFETDILEEFENERNTGIISDALDEELQDLVEHHLLIIPIFRNNTLVIFAVKLNDENPEVKLYFLEDKIEPEDEEHMSELSELILDLLTRSYEAVDLEFNEETVNGDSAPVKSIADMLQVVENLVCENVEASIRPPETEIRHKIVDR
eukprot:CAMPEP_0205810400 /NCGR_PEP_ID=MMETSP0205-20121125/14579_1 /ASSEMBLY_ACC=CAM_ASM_000278 /TAXON_ID=36767 /ORGANISM="Euplotes focardii, Strain TN1" /LENGTH=196 /DNA_ID=CAMNT_0053088491 /DNA_START=270 /DNA_END=857 /DNA_ORIENTATION=-